MLVKSRFKGLKSRRRACIHVDAGSTLVTVLIVMLVLTVGGLALSAIVVKTTVVTADTSSRSSAQAEVDGAIAVQSVELTEGRLTCDPGAQKTGTLKNGASAVAVNWTLDCSVTGLVGTATIQARANVNGQQAMRNAVFTYAVTPKPAITYGSPADPIMMFGENTTFNSNNIVVDPARPVNVTIPYGNFTCNTRFPGNLTVKGNITVQGGCEVTGNMISVTGAIDGPGLKVGKDVLAYGKIKMGGSSLIGGNLYSLTGGLEMPSGDRVSGDAAVKGDIVLNSGAFIGGNLSSSAGRITTFNSTAKVNGKVTTGGAGQNLLGNIDGDVQLVGGLTSNMTGNIIKGNVIAGGASELRATVFQKTLTIPATVPDGQISLGWAATIQGQPAKLSPLTPGFQRPATVVAPTFPTMPTMPTMPPWYEYKFAAVHWPGYHVIELAAVGVGPGSCDYFKTSHGAWLTALSASDPEALIIDGRKCGTLSTNDGEGATIKVSKNLILLADRFDLTNARVSAAAGVSGKPSVWVMKSDDDPDDHRPTCAPSGNTVLNMSQFDLTVATMVYTPCTIQVNGASSVYGQLYGGDWAGGGGAGITFGPADIGMPGMDGNPLPSGGGPGSGGGEVIVGSFALQSTRDVSVP